MGPGQDLCIRAGLDFAQAIGKKFDIPVIPVNLTEAYVMSPRIDPKNRRHANFPFVSVIASSDHTEIVLSRGVGLHTILGISVDITLN